MKRMRLDNLLEKDLHIVEKRKFYFITPAVIAVIAAILMIIFNFTLGSPLNLGTDFTGGYSIDVKLRGKLNDGNYDYYCDRIGEVMRSVPKADGTGNYDITVENYQKQGSGDSAAIHVKYRAVKGVDEEGMLKDVNPAIRSALEDEILMVMPSVTEKYNLVTLTYTQAVTNDVEDMSKVFADTVVPQLLEKYGEGCITFADGAKNAVSLNEGDKKQLVIACTSIADNAALRNDIAAGMKISDEFSGEITNGDLVGATVSTELLFNAILAVSLALVFMLCYIGLRFQLSSGLACVIALFHDVFVMFAFMAICRIPINNTFIAALITILGYSINNSIILFDRVRENTRSVYAKNMSPEQIANKSIRETLLRSINTTITTLIMILMVAIIGVDDIRVFAFPIIIGLIAGTFSSICIAPSLWSMFQYVGKKNRQNFYIAPKDKKGKKEKAVADKAKA